MKFITLLIYLTTALSCISTDHKSSVDITIRRGNFHIDNGAIWVDVIVNNKDSVKAIFDTGAPTGLILSDCDNVISSGVAKVSFDGDLHYNTHISKWNHSNTLIGIRGMDQHRYLSINYDSMKVQLLPKGSIIDTLETIILDYEFNKGLIFVDIPITYYRHNNKFTGKYSFLVDTGWPSGFAITDPPNDYNDFIHSIDFSYRYADNKDNRKDNLLFKLDSINFAGKTIERVNGCYVYSRSLNAYHKNDVVGIIGLEILKEFNTIIDFEEQRIILKAHNINDQPFNLDYFNWTLGFTISQSDKTVNVIEKNSEAERVGIRLGDFINSINGIPSYQLNKSVMDSLLLLNLGSKVNVSVERGGVNIEVDYIIK